MGVVWGSVWSWGSVSVVSVVWAGSSSGSRLGLLSEENSLSVGNFWGVSQETAWQNLDVSSWGMSVSSGVVWSNIWSWVVAGGSAGQGGNESNLNFMVVVGF
ncbi:hypothetical protein WDU94_007971 [Cyamophila willieti]